MIHHVLGTECLFPLTCMWVLCRRFVHTPAFDELVPRGGKFVLVVNKNMYVFARGGGNLELFWWKKKRVVQRGGKFVLFVDKTTHVFARGDGNFK